MQKLFTRSHFNAFFYTHIFNATYIKYPMHKQTLSFCLEDKGYSSSIKIFCLCILFVLEYSEVLLHTMEAIDYNASDGFTLNKEEGYTGYSASAMDVLDMVQVCFHYISIKCGHSLFIKNKNDDKEVQNSPVFMCMLVKMLILLFLHLFYF